MRLAYAVSCLGSEVNRAQLLRMQQAKVLCRHACTIDYRRSLLQPLRQVSSSQYGVVPTLACSSNDFCHVFLAAQPSHLARVHHVCKATSSAEFAAQPGRGGACTFRSQRLVYTSLLMEWRYLLNANFLVPCLSLAGFSHRHCCLKAHHCQTLTVQTRRHVC